MKVAYLVTANPHGHDYGVDFLYDGLCEVLGFENVIDLPEKKSLHDGQDECGIDSDQRWPRKGNTLDHVRDCDIVFIAMQPGGETSHELLAACRLVPACIPIVALDYSDSTQNNRDWYDYRAGRRTIYFKRELQIGDFSAYPLPMCYPAKRAVVRQEPAPARLFYHASAHGDGSSGPGKPRYEIVKWLDRNRVQGAQYDVRLTPGQSDRGTSDEYHERMRHAGVGISWNGAANWDCNRFWENFAFGLAQVAQRPWIQIPNDFEHGTHVYYADSPFEAVHHLTRLLRDDGKRHEMASAGQEHFLAHHTSAARAQYVLSTCGARDGLQRSHHEQIFDG